VTPTLSGFLISADLVIGTAVGGRRSVIGPAVGAILIGVLTTELRARVAVWEVIVALVFILVVLYLPNGLVGLLAPLQRRLAALSARRPAFIRDCRAKHPLPGERG
jgi:branched-chain amino acid transport system permease protein